MKKSNFIKICLFMLLILSLILLLYVKISFGEINYNLESLHNEVEKNKENTNLRTNRILTLVEQNKVSTQEIINRLDLQLSTRINELSRDADIKNRNLGITLEEIKKTRLSEADKLNNLIGSYIDETMKNDTSDEMSYINDRLISIYKEIGENKNNTNLKNIEIQRKITQSQENTKKIISGLEGQLNAIFTELNKYTDNRSSSPEDNSSALNKAVESDYQKQLLLSKGSFEFQKKNFITAIKIYKKILDTDPSNTEALVYYSASLYYLNPGDESNYHTAKKNLVPLLETKDLPAGEKRTILDVLAGISREEGDTASLDKYQLMKKQMEGGSQ